ncbi:MAG: hypothetical protein O3C36_03575, partial [archaeon]|nr:hypothetical protein [archaeon]
QRLYVSGKVRYLPEEGALTDADQTVLEGFAAEVIRRAGDGMNVDSSMLDHLIERLCEEQISEARTSIYNIAALCLNDLEGRQQLLACTTAEEAMNELQSQLVGLYDKTD